MNHRHHWEMQKEFRRLFGAADSAEKHARKIIRLLAEHSELKPSLTDEQLGQLNECRLFLSWLIEQAAIRDVPEDRPVRRHQPAQKRPSRASERERTRKTRKSGKIMRRIADDYERRKAKLIEQQREREQK